MTITTAANSSPSSSSSSTSTPTSNPNPNPNPNSNPSPSSNTPWWETLTRARSVILSLSPLLPSQTLTLIADSDRPVHALLSSSIFLPTLSRRLLSDPLSGSGEDPLCNWLYDTFLLADPPELRLLVLSLLPHLSHLYLSRVVSDSSASLPGFEAVLLAVYSAETKLRGGKPQLVSVPDLSLPSLYHTPRPPPPRHHHHRGSHPSSSPLPPPAPGILSPPLEPQAAVKSTKRACIVGVALDSFFKKISLLPARSKSDLCHFVVSWAGQDCRCRYEFDDDFNGEVTGNCGEEDDREGNRIPLPWELLQPVLRIIGHCLLAPGNDQDVRDAGSAAVRAVYARAMHDIHPQAILAARSLIRLDVSARKASREAAAAAAMLAAAPGGVASNPVTPNKPKRPDVLLFSK